MHVTSSFTGVEFSDDNTPMLTYAVRVVHNKEVLETTYMVGYGHLDLDSLMKSPDWPKFNECEQHTIATLADRPERTVRYSKEVVSNALYKAAYCEKFHPSDEDILNAIAMDASCVMGGETFDDFCNELGYSNDSIKAKQAYDACCEADKFFRRCGVSPTDYMED